MRAWSCITSYPLRGLPYLAYDNVNPATVNSMMLHSSMHDLKRSIWKDFLYRPLISSTDWSTCSLQDWTCRSLPTVAEFLKLTHCFRNSATFPDLYNRPNKIQSSIRQQFFCGCPRYLCSEGTRTWVSPTCCTAQLTVSYMLCHWM